MKHNAEKSRIIEKSRTKTPCHVLYALYVISCSSRLQLSFSENGHWSSSEEKEKVAGMDDTCSGKGIGFGSQPMKIAEASSRLYARFFEIVHKIERCFRYQAFPQDRTAIKAG